MKLMHEVYFYRTEEDKVQHRAFVLRWYLNEEKDKSAFSIEPPDSPEEGITISSKYPCVVEEEFQGMIRMMKLMIQPFEVVMK